MPELHLDTLSITTSARGTVCGLRSAQGDLKPLFRSILLSTIKASVVLVVVYHQFKVVSARCVVGRADILDQLLHCDRWRCRHC